MHFEEAAEQTRAGVQFCCPSVVSRSAGRKEEEEVEEMQRAIHHQCFIFFIYFFFISGITWRASILAEAQCINGMRMWWVDEQTGCCMTEPYNSGDTHTHTLTRRRSAQGFYLSCVCHSVISSGEFHFRCQEQKSDSESFSRSESRKNEPLKMSE